MAPSIRSQIVDACREMNASGLNQGMSGNISVRVEETLLITPSAIPYDRMVPDDVAAMTLTGDYGAWEGPRRPSSEWRFHLDIMLARPEIGAIVHAHPINCTALAMARRGIPPCHYMVATFGGNDVRCGGYATFGTAALSTKVLEALEGRTACLLANHGMIACGQDLGQAMWRAMELEALARQYLSSLAIGGPHLLSESEMMDAIAQFSSYRP